MTTADPQEELATEKAIDLRLEVVVIPVTDVDRAKRFYGRLGWRLDADFGGPDDYRVVQFTPPGSTCSIQFGRRLTTAAPGSAQNLYLIVSDVVAARAALIEHGAEVSKVIHRAGPGTAALPGPDPQRQSYASFASFQRSRWQQLARAGGHSAPARESRPRDDICVPDRPRRRASARGVRARQA